MKHLLTAIPCFFALSMSAQTPYNPDSDSDNLIGFDDLLDFLPLYGQEFYPEESEPVVQIINGELLSNENLDTTWFSSTAANLRYEFEIDSVTDILLVQTDDLRVAMANSFVQDNISLEIAASLPETGTYRRCMIAYTGEFVDYNGTSVEIEVYDGDLQLDEYNLWFPVNRIRTFYFLNGVWFSAGGPLQD